MLIDVLRSERIDPVLVDRRFSRNVDDVGRFSALKLLQVAGLMIRLLRMLARDRPAAVVFFATNRPGSFLVDWLLSEMMRAATILGFGRPRLIHYLHTEGFERLSERGRGWRWLVGRLLSSADRVVSLSPILEGDIERWVPPSRRLSIPNAVEPLDVVAPASDGPCIVLFLSNLLPEKGALTFARLAVELAREGIDARFILAGGAAPPDVEEALLQLIAQEDGRCVSAIGAVAGRDKWRLLEQADLLVFPSTYPYEAQPLTIIEGLATATPAIAYDVGGIPDLIRDGVTGELAPAGDYESLKVKVRRLIQDGDARERYAAAARSDYESRFSKAAYSGAWRSLMADVLRGTE